jgi:hypothetical protein
MAIRPRIAVTYNRVDAQSRREDIQYIDFCREVLTSRDGWDATVVLTTDTPLGVLMWIDTFRLPSETEEQAYYRRQCAGL